MHFYNRIKSPTHALLKRNYRRTLARVLATTSSRLILLRYQISNEKSISIHQKRYNKGKAVSTCRGGPSGVDDAALLNVRAEADVDLVKVSAEHGSVPDGRAITDCDLTGKYNVRGNICIHGDLRKPLPQWNDLPLPAVVPLHALIRRRCHSRKWRRRRSHRSFGREKSTESGTIS